MPYSTPDPTAAREDSRPRAAAPRAAIGSDLESSVRVFDAVVLGVSAGGLDALSVILPGLPPGFALPVIVAQHPHARGSAYLATHLDGRTEVRVKDAEHGEALVPGTVYLAPQDSHILVSPDSRLELSSGKPINGSRPSIDVLFNSAAKVFGERLVGAIMTGASSDGASGLKAIHDHGGFTVVQDPDTAESEFMPRAALRSVSPNRVLELAELGEFLVGLGR